LGEPIVGISHFRFDQSFDFQLPDSPSYIAHTSRRQYLQP